MNRGSPDRPEDRKKNPQPLGDWEWLRNRALEGVIEQGYDPVSVSAAVLKWGQTMAVVLLKVVKAVEREFGERGQEVCRNVFLEHGMEMGREIGEHLKPLLPERMDRTNLIETWLRIISWVNRNIWASPDSFRTLNENEGYFDILWCPHQDIYTARDCRIQRWLVSGIMTGIGSSLVEEMERRYSGDLSEFFNVNLEVTDLIPRGAKTCHFRVWRRREGEEDTWQKHSQYLERRELEELKRGPSSR
jgi:hypothetical protein